VATVFSLKPSGTAPVSACQRMALPAASAPITALPSPVTPTMRESGRFWSEYPDEVFVQSAVFGGTDPSPVIVPAITEPSNDVAVGTAVFGHAALGNETGVWPFVQANEPYWESEPTTTLPSPEMAV